MSPSQLPPTEEKPKSLIGRILYSDFAGKVSQIPPFSWIVRWVAYRLATRHIGKTMTPPKLRVYGSGLQGALDGIVRDVVEILGFAGAMVATFDNGEVLPVKALYVEPTLATREQIRTWEEQASELIGTKISLTDPKIARVYIYKKEDQANLGVQAAHARQYMVSNELFDLFKTAIVPDSLREFIRGVQQALGIQQVITVPFFIKTTSVDGAIIMSTTTIQDTNKGEFVGNLFAAKRGEITTQDIRVLSTFAQYVASFILSERRRLQVEVIEKLILDIQKGLHSEEEVLQRIVKGVVDDLGYVGAMLATYNAAEDVLPVRALYTGRNIDLAQIHVWEGQASDLIGRRLSLTDPAIAKVYLHQEAYKNNLSVIAAEKEKPVSSTELFDLFTTPMVPDSLREFIKGVQEGLGIRSVIAVPFFLETTMEDGKLSKELIGNLFVASRSQEIQLWEIDILNAFGQQAAAGLRNVDLYQKAEDRRKAAEIFGKMAFSATASVHALKNKMSVVKGALQIIRSIENDNLRISALNNVGEVITLIENLHEPGKLEDDISVDVNACIRRAAERTFGINTPWIKLNLTPDLPVKTIPEMLTEAFKVLIKNANEAMSTEAVPEENRLLEIVSSRIGDTVCITIKDHGMGIAPENLEKVFEMSYTTKKSGLGFGLFWTKDYIEGLGGNIAVKSQLGEGTTFTIELPIVKEPAPDS
jgi:signal transduction histidine kinase